MAKNDESILTDRFRQSIISEGGMSIKLSDKFTRGIPDLYTVFNRVVFVEMKMDKRPISRRESRCVESHRALGISGAQDDLIRRMNGHSRDSVCVVNGTLDGEWRLWLPVRSAVTAANKSFYRAAVLDFEGIIKWLK